MNYIGMMTFFPRKSFDCLRKHSNASRTESKHSSSLCILSASLWNNDPIDFAHLKCFWDIWMSSELSLRLLFHRISWHAASASPEVAYAQRTNLCRCIRCLVNQLKSEMRNQLTKALWLLSEVAEVEGRWSPKMLKRCCWAVGLVRHGKYTCWNCRYFRIIPRG